MVFLNSLYLYLYLIIEKFGIITLQTLKVFKKQFQVLNGIKEVGTRTQMNIFRKYIPHKSKKFDYKTPEWINTLVISALKKVDTCENVL